MVKMEKKHGSRLSVAAPTKSHKCGPLCLGTLTFHPRAVGHSVRLSQGCRLAERTNASATFRDGLVFSSRPVAAEERIYLRVKEDVSFWHGGLRLGFTNVPPADRALPLPSMAIPDLTGTSGHWAAPVDRSCCGAGTKLEFWVSRQGNVYVRSNDGRKHQLQTGVDLSKPLWAMVDVYGQTRSVFLRGSKKRSICNITRRSCPVPEPDYDRDHILMPEASFLDGNWDDSADEGSEVDCVVCLCKRASVTLLCGHRCLCRQCACRVVEQLGKCPLCRRTITLQDARPQLGVSSETPRITR